MIVIDVIDTCWPVLMAVELKLRSEPLVPQLPSYTQVPVESTTRNQVAVPVALALESAVIAENVSTPPEAAAQAGSEQVSSAKSVVAVPQVAGRVPS